ncbi:hypothetical protein ABZV67_45525 [Streptomyces sp. NPDC005065]|uniref:hypothetical protein n=1 Tax=Streptomyces sp. NPDC005065 TaxID=3154461 RepID=UPI0033A8F6FB
MTYINGLKVSCGSLRAGPDIDMKRASVLSPTGARVSAARLRYNRPDDTVDVTEMDPLDAVPLFGRFKEGTAEP